MSINLRLDTITSIKAPQAVCDIASSNWMGSSIPIYKCIFLYENMQAMIHPSLVAISRFGFPLTLPDGTRYVHHPS